MTNVRQVLREVHERFAAAPLRYGQGTDNAWDEAVALVLGVAGLPDIEASLDSPLSEQEAAEIRGLAERRVAERQPLAYLLGRAPYCGETFAVSPGVVVPRSPIGPLLRSGLSPWVDAPTRILDLCCGSGCLGILAAKQFPNARVVLADIDPLAVATARRNIAAHGLEGRVAALHSDLFADISQREKVGVPTRKKVGVPNTVSIERKGMGVPNTGVPAREKVGVPTGGEGTMGKVDVPEKGVGAPKASGKVCVPEWERVGVPNTVGAERKGVGVPKKVGAPERAFNLILCNPPYVDAEAMASLPAEFAQEPALGLAGGGDGLAIMNRVLGEVSRYLANDGVLVGEVGDAAERLEAEWPRLPFFWPDLPDGGAGVFLLRAADTP